MKLLILDKDGTLTTTASGETFVQHPEDQVLLPGVAEALQRYQDEGWKVAIASNQGGVAAGHKSLDEAVAEMRYCITLLPSKVPFSFLCPDFQGEECWMLDGAELIALHGVDVNLSFEKSFRKPSPGMIFAARAMQLREVLKTLFVGDRPEDQQTAANAGVQFMWAEEWRNLEPSTH